MSVRATSAGLARRQPRSFGLAPELGGSAHYEKRPAEDLTWRVASG